MTPISEMTPAELNEAVAVEVMDWHKKISDAGDIWVDKGGMFKSFGLNWDKPFVPADNDTGHSDCYRAEERMRERGLAVNYTEKLTDTVVHDIAPDEMKSGLLLYCIAHATCEQKCRAMLETVRGAG